jgi:hypothetical protein
LLGLVGIIATNALISFMIPFAYHSLTVAAVLIGALVIVFALRPRFYQRPVDPVAFWIPFLSHAYLLAAGLVSGVIVHPPVLLAISLAMILVAAYLHWPSIRHVFQKQKPA